MGLRYPRKRDVNEKEVVAALRARGATVTHLDDSGVPDLLVGYHGETFLLEVKQSSKKDGSGKSNKSKGGEGELTEAQVEWWKMWTGARAVIVHSIEEAIAAIGAT